jgi:hypothetical protein
MNEILHFKKGAKIIKLNASETNLNVWWNFMCHCENDETTEKNHLTG